MELAPESTKPSILRLKRASGQLNAVIRMMEEGRDCSEVITQLAAVSKAIDRAGYAIIAQGMKSCLAKDPSGESVDTKKLERLFLSLS
ncbi:MAG: metal-sensitive transcriptional regulator [Propionibacteriaceae bacterium]|nr:metal-sensitive transcriptional regulator [Propionibacteriaceae bacterium]